MNTWPGFHGGLVSAAAGATANKAANTATAAKKGTRERTRAMGAVMAVPGCIGFRSIIGPIIGEIMTPPA